MLHGPIAGRRSRSLWTITARLIPRSTPFLAAIYRARDCAGMDSLPACPGSVRHGRRRFWRSSGDWCSRAAGARVAQPVLGTPRTLPGGIGSYAVGNAGAPGESPSVRCRSEEVMLVRQIADSKLAQFAYLIGCPRTGEAIVIDPERDVDRYFDSSLPATNCASSLQQIPIFMPTTSRACGRWRRAACSSMRRKRAAPELGIPVADRRRVSAPAARPRRAVLGPVHRIPRGSHARTYTGTP